VKVKVPKQSKVGAREYKVLIENDLVQNQGNRGETRYHKQEIVLDSRLSQEQRIVTFIHERLHTIEEHFCGRVNLSEEIISGLAEGLYQFLKEDLGIEFDWSEIDGNKS
jgi:CII-binding regulator of phage lambda lysogenization HflD